MRAFFVLFLFLSCLPTMQIINFPTRCTPSFFFRLKKLKGISDRQGLGYVKIDTLCVLYMHIVYVMYLCLGRSIGFSSVQCHAWPIASNSPSPPLDHHHGHIYHQSSHFSDSCNLFLIFFFSFFAFVFCLSSILLGFIFTIPSSQTTPNRQNFGLCFAYHEIHHPSK